MAIVGEFEGIADGTSEVSTNEDEEDVGDSVSISGILIPILLGAKLGSPSPKYGSSGVGAGEVTLLVGAFVIGFKVERGSVGLVVSIGTNGGNVGDRVSSETGGGVATGGCVNPLVGSKVNAPSGGFAVASGVGNGVGAGVTYFEKKDKDKCI